MLMLVPALVLVLFGAMFYHGKAHHLPVAIIDQDQGELSQSIIYHIEHNPALSVAILSSELIDAENAINRLHIGGYIHIPNGTQNRLVRGEDSQIYIAYNQAFFSIGSGTASALSASTKDGTKAFAQEHLRTLLPHPAGNVPHIKASVLFNPNLSYELFLEPFLVPAILHLLLCCLVAFAIGQELKERTSKAWLGTRPISAFLGKISVYVCVIALWTWLWLMWLVLARGWSVAGSLVWVMIAQWLLYVIYALFGAMVVLITKDANKSFGILAIYGGSSMSFAGISLPLNNAPQFTQIWSEIIPFTSFARLQTQQWVIGSPIWVSMPNVMILAGFLAVFMGVSVMLIKRLDKSTKQTPPSGTATTNTAEGKT